MKYRLVIRRPRPLTSLGRLAAAIVWWVGVAGLAAFVFGVSFYLAMRVEMRSTEVQVPELAGLGLDEASRKVEPLALVLQVVEQRNDRAVASGRILQQTPPAGAAVRRGRKVKLILSLGGRVLEVPDLTGQAARAVEIGLRQQELGIGDEARVSTFRADAGTVIGQVPRPGSPAVPRARIHRLVSDGPPPVAWVMPDLTGLERRAAERWVSTSGFRRGAVRQVRVIGQTPGTVVGQLPLAGYPIRSRDIVELTIAN